MPTKFKSFTKSLIVLILILVLVGLVFGFKFIVNKKATEVNEISQSLALASHKHDNLNQLKSKLMSLDDKIKKINEFVLRKDNVVLFIESLEKLGRETKVDLMVDSVQEDEEIVFLVKASGSFNSLYNLIKLVEVMPFPVFIEDLKLGLVPKTKENMKSVWQAEITIRLLTVDEGKKKVDKPKQDE